MPSVQQECAESVWDLTEEAPWKDVAPCEIVFQVGITHALHGGLGSYRERTAFVLPEANF